MKEIVNGMTNEMKLEFDSRSANEAFAQSDSSVLYDAAEPYAGRGL